ncbi:MAG: sugar ABC transporter permease [Helcococcus sp.]|nr:sugar ABC transporter permease [Helcococcus sp.]
MKKRGKTRFILISLIPALLLYLGLMVYPTLTIFYESLFKTSGLSQNRQFVGLNNFKTLISDARFLKSFQNTIFLMVIVTIVTMVMAIFLAAVLSKEKVKGQSFFRIILYIPNILSIAVISSIFSAIYGMDNGMINGLGKLFSAETWKNISFLGDRVLVNYSIAIAMIWQAVGYYMVMYMSTMAQIPNHLYEAANIDGASKIRQFFDITLPLSWETVRTTLTFYVISNINIAFQIVKVLTSGGPSNSSETLLNYQYEQAYSNSVFGYGLAIGVVVFIFSFALSAIVNKITERDIIQF